MFTKKPTRSREREAREEFRKEFRDNFDLEPYQLEHCCGITQIGGWNGFNDSDLIKYKKVIVEEVTGAIDGSMREYGVVVTTINHNQVKSVVPILKALGFTFAAKGVNNRHGNTVYIWTKVINPSKRSHLPAKKK